MCNLPMYDLDNFAFPLNWFFYRTTEAGELLINYVVRY